MSVGENLRRVHERIAETCCRIGRDAGEIRLCVVTKLAGVDLVREAVREGAMILGENRVQAAEPKIRETRSLANVSWHLIGHLQRNKARRAVELFDRIDAVDGMPVAQRLSELGVERGRPVRALVEVNTSAEPQKGGFASESAGEALGRIRELPGIELEGLMTMAPFTDDRERVRASFACLRELRDGLPFASELRVLSMGMTNDFEIAVEEGSTFVRIGTAIFA
ncbi:MAG: YggS family pyridoxal phosphate-dependent enzyme [Candidatus Eiseniibacteriota bacterium]